MTGLDSEIRSNVQDHLMNEEIADNAVELPDVWIDGNAPIGAGWMCRNGEVR